MDLDETRLMLKKIAAAVLLFLGPLVLITVVHAYYNDPALTRTQLIIGILWGVILFIWGFLWCRSALLWFRKKDQ